MTLCKKCLALAETTPKINPWENVELKINDGENCDRCGTAMYNEVEIKSQSLPEMTTTKNILLIITMFFVAGLLLGFAIGIAVLGGMK